MIGCGTGPHVIRDVYTGATELGKGAGENMAWHGQDLVIYGYLGKDRGWLVR